SRMLDARYSIVPFTGRRDELAQLLQWREEGGRLAARWLYAPGGQGKTRLAAEFAAQSSADGWRVVTATHGPGSLSSSQDLSMDNHAGVIVVVDYADRWPLSHLKW